MLIEQADSLSVALMHFRAQVTTIAIMGDKESMMTGMLNLDPAGAASTATYVVLCSAVAL
jgi:hypothetical protein